MAPWDRTRPYTNKFHTVIINNIEITLLCRIMRMKFLNNCSQYIRSFADMSLLGDLMIIPGVWVLMGQFPRVEPMPLALYTYLQSVHPVWIALLPIGLALAIVGRGLSIAQARHKIRASISAFFLLGRLPLFEGLACFTTRILLHNSLTPTDIAGMHAWAGLTIVLGIILVAISKQLLR
jgi:hypothetical protein